jgi:hypothetical protein
MLKKHLERLFVLLAFLFVVSCNFNPDSLTPPGWETSLIGPMATSRITLEDLLDFDSLTFDYKVSVSELDPNLPTDGTPVPVPPISIPTLPPDSVIITNGFKYAVFDSGEIQFEFINNLPISLNPGQIISVYSSDARSQTGLGDKIFDFTLSETLQPSSSVTTVSSILEGDTVSAKLFVVIDNVSSNGSATPVSFDENSGFELRFSFEEVKIREVGLEQGNQFVLGDTTPFSFSTGTVPSSLESGFLKLKFRNGIPLNIDVSLDLFDIDKNFIDNFIGDGDAIISASDTSSIIVPVDQNNINQLSSAAYLVSSVLLEDQALVGDTVIINSDSLVQVRAIAEVELNIVP